MWWPGAEGAHSLPGVSYFFLTSEAPSCRDGTWFACQKGHAGCAGDSSESRGTSQ